MKPFLTILCLILPCYSTFYPNTKENPIRAIKQAEWKKIATGKDPFIWMINFFCTKPKDKCAKCYELKEDYIQAAQILKGYVKAASYEVVHDFPAFIRIPTTMFYVPNSTEPYVFNMENFPEQVKRASFRLVTFFQDLVINHIHTDQVRHITASWKLQQLRTDVMMNIVANEIPNQCTFVLLYNDFKKEQKKIQLLALVATMVYTVYNIDKEHINFGIANFVEVSSAFEFWDERFVVPKFIFFGPRNAPNNKQINSFYNDRLDAADMARWVISRVLDMTVIPGDVVQINVRREAGFVGQVINIEDKQIYLGTH